MMARPKTGIFAPFVFNKIMELTFIFSPSRFFPATATQEWANRLNFNDIDFYKIFVIRR